MQIITSREVWLRRNHNKSLADSYQNPISEWQVTTELHLVAGYKAIPPYPGSVEKMTSTRPVSCSKKFGDHWHCLLYTSDAADDRYKV